jgi:UDP-2,3-diacylglucosamine pyrophosphatase LpxH
MRKFLQWLLTKPLTWMNNKLAASPKKEIVFKSLGELYLNSLKKKTTRLKVLRLDLLTAKFIVFSDQHKGNTSWADDFNACETNYTAALDHYNRNGFTFINLGDSEELWKFTAKDIVTCHPEAFKAEAAFQPDRYFKTFGNHDIIWKNKLDVKIFFKHLFRMPLPVYEGIVLRSKEPQLDIFLTHGHQGDLMSDNNAFSTWIVAHIWMPMQRYLRINPNSPSNDYRLRNEHNQFMYQWSSEQNRLILVTGHTHQPVFASGKYFNHPSNKIDTGKSRESLKPSYFNSGCCCYNDGDITGIEISEGKIRLVKWFDEEISSKRKVLEEVEIDRLMKDLGNPADNSIK